MDREPPALSLPEVAALHLNYLVPIILRGAIVARPVGTRLTSKFHPDPIGLRFFTRLRRKYASGLLAGHASDGGLGFTRTVLVLEPGLIDAILSDDGLDYEVADLNHKVISRFAPGALIAQEQPKRAPLRRFVEQKLGTGTAIGSHRHAGYILDVIDREVSGLERNTPQRLCWQNFASLAIQIATQAVLGRDRNGKEIPRSENDEIGRLLTQLIYRAAFVPGWRCRAFGRYYHLINQRLTENTGPSLTGRFSQQHMSDAQSTFWLFAVKDALDTNLPRTLALILAYPAIYAEVISELNGKDLSDPHDIDRLALLEGCALEAARLWTATPLLLRKKKKDGRLGQFHVRAGTQMLIPAAFIHRDPAVYGHLASAFHPHQWRGGAVPASLQFSLGPRRCAGRELALFLIKATLARLLTGPSGPAAPSPPGMLLRSPELQTHGRIPELFDTFAIEIERTAAVARGGTALSS